MSDDKIREDAFNWIEDHGQMTDHRDDYIDCYVAGYAACNTKLERLMKENEILKIVLLDIKDEALLTRMSVNELAVLATRESLERYFIETQNDAREALKKIEEIKTN